MKGNFVEIVSASIEWTKAILFRPFNFKKWIFLYIIALLAFQMQGGCNFKSNPKTKDKEIVETGTSEEKYRPDIFAGDFKSRPFEKIDDKYKNILIPLVILLSVPILLLFLLFQWIYSIFSFVFIESIVNNDASIKLPFKKNRSIGSSYFAWNILYLVVFLATSVLIVKLGYGSLSRLGVFVRGSQIAFGAVALAILPYIIIGGFFIFVSAILAFFITNYVLVVMYKDRLSILKAIPVAFSLVQKDVGAFIKYIFVKMAIWIITAFASSAVIFVIFMVLFIPGALIAALFYSIFKTIPVGAQAIYILVLSLLGIPLLIILSFLINAIFLPFPVFLKTFNLKFIARIDEKYNLFRLQN